MKGGRGRHWPKQAAEPCCGKAPCLGEALGLTFQQVQKYERGANRISASKLFEISKALAVRVAFFFEDLEGQATSNDNPLLFVSDPMTRGASGEAMAFLEVWPTLEPVTRKAVMDLVQAFAAVKAA